jgi:hypothetical protein
MHVHLIIILLQASYYVNGYGCMAYYKNATHNGRKQGANFAGPFYHYCALIVKFIISANQQKATGF